MNKTFTFNGIELRHVEIEGASWFNSADACRCLGLGLTKGTYLHLRKLRDDERRITPNGNRGKGAQATTYITESGLYKLIMRSDKANAKPFQDWVTREVLPAIRKTGGYLLNENAREVAHADERTEMPLRYDQID